MQNQWLFNECLQSLWAKRKTCMPMMKPTIEYVTMTSAMQGFQSCQEALLLVFHVLHEHFSLFFPFSVLGSFPSRLSTG